MNLLSRPGRAHSAGPPVSTRIVDGLSGVAIVLLAHLGWERGFRAVINACGVSRPGCG